jgi:sulfur carrier protein
VKIVLNGSECEVGESITVAELVATETMVAGGRGIAVAIDSEVVPHSRWESIKLREGQRVELLAAIQGG